MNIFFSNFILINLGGINDLLNIISINVAVLKFFSIRHIIWINEQQHFLQLFNSKFLYVFLSDITIVIRIKVLNQLEKKLKKHTFSP